MHDRAGRRHDQHFAPLRIVLVASLTLLAGCGASTEPAPAPPLVRTLIVGSRAQGSTSFTGTVRARVESDLSFRIPGKIVARVVEAGQGVRRGQLLARLDSADYALAADAAGAQVAAARAESRRAVADLRRLSGLADRGFVTRRSLDAAQADADGAAARLRALEANARSAGNQSGYAGLFADADGILMSVAAEPGQVVTAGQPVVRLARVGARDAVVAIPESARALTGRPAEVQLYGEGARHAATLYSLAAAADPATRTYEARYAIVGGEALPLGATATVRLRRAEGARFAVPLAALHDGGGGPGVWVVGRDNRVAFRPVRIATLGDESAEIAAGLRGGERVVALGAHLLEPGERVRFEPQDRAAR